MTILKLLKKNIYIVIFTMVFISFAIIPIVYPDSNDNHYRDDSSSVFSPGYLNAAKYQAEAIMNQQQMPQKSLLQNIAEYVLGKTENTVQQDAADKPKPALQQKQSLSAGKAKVAAAVLNITPGVIPADIRNSVQKYIMQASGTVEPGYQLQALTGKYFAAWAVAGTNAIKAQYFDAQGTAMGALLSLTTGSTNTVNIDNVSILSNGNMAVLWDETSSGGGRTLNEQFFNSSGGHASTLIQLAGAMYAGISAVYILSGDDVEAAWCETDSNKDSILKTQFFTSMGVEGASFATPVANGVRLDNLSILSDGNVAVTWNDENSYALNTMFFDSQKVSSNVVQLADGENSIFTTESDKVSVTVLSDDEVAVFWSEGESDGSRTVRGQFFSSDGAGISIPALEAPLNAGMIDASIDNVSILSDGSVAVLWSEAALWSESDPGWREGDPDLNYSLKMQVFSPGSDITPPLLTFNVGSYSDLNTIGTLSATTIGQIENVSILSNGYVAVFWTEGEDQGPYQYLCAQFFKPDGYNGYDTVSIQTGGVMTPLWVGSGSDIVSAVPLGPVKFASVVTPAIDSVSILPDGNIAIFWSEMQTGGDVLNAQSFDPQGDIGHLLNAPASPNTNLTDSGNIVGFNNPINPFTMFGLDGTNYLSPEVNGVTGGTENISSIFGALLTNKSILAQNMQNNPSVEISENRSKDPFEQSALLVPKYVSSADVETAMRLADILKNPTDDQKTIIDTIKALLGDTHRTEKEPGKQPNPELKKAQDDLLNAVANILLAQAVPDLLKQGDISNIKTIFQELDTKKNKIMLEYAKSTKPYYENMIKDLAKNMAILQSKNLLSPNMAKDELDKLPPSELDRILEKIKNMKDKSFEEAYILQQEAKYRKDYLDPNKKKLEDDMKGLLNNFTARLSEVLKTVDKK